MTVDKEATGALARRVFELQVLQRLMSRAYAVQRAESAGFDAALKIAFFERLEELGEEANR